MRGSALVVTTAAVLSPAIAELGDFRAGRLQSEDSVKSHYPQNAFLTNKRRILVRAMGRDIARVRDAPKSQAAPRAI